MASPAFAAFATRLLDMADDEQDPTRVANALAKLHHVVFFKLLPPGEMPRVVAITRRYLSGTYPPIVWLAAVELAAATGDEELRAMVAGIASGALHPTFVEGADLGLWVRSAAQRALLKRDDVSRASGLS